MAKWYQRINPFKRKDAPVYGGIELLKRIFGTTWSKSTMLEKYETSLYVYACVSKISEKVANLDLNLYQILNSSGDTKEIINHEAVDLLYRVNPFQTKTEFFKITVINLKLAGDAFWYKIRNNQGKVVELWNLRPDYMEIVKSETDFIKEYRFTKPNTGTTNVIEPDDIVHFKSPSPLDEYYGVSPVKSAQSRIDTEVFATEYQKNFFLNNARPDAVLKTNGLLNELQKEEIRESFQGRHRGIGKNSKIAIFETGLEYQQISLSQREMDYIESLKFTRDDILVAFHVPKPIVAITDDVNRANAETAMYIFLSETIKPTMEMLVEKINELLIIPDFGENLFLDFPDPTPEDVDKKLTYYEKGIAGNWLLINEIRTKEGLEPVSGGWEWYMPLMNQAAGGLKDQEKALAAGWVERIEGERKAKALRVFRGKEMLRQKFILVETVTKDLKKAFTGRGNADKKKDIDEAAAEAKVPAALIKGELRDKYAALVLKAVDYRATKLKQEMNAFSQKENAALINKLSQQDITKAVGSGVKATIKEFFKEQGKVTATFIFPFIEEYVRQAGMEAMAFVNPDKGFELTARIRKVLEKRAKEFGLGVSDTTRDKITAAISAGLEAGEGMVAISDRIGKVYDEFPTYRSDMIARTESTAANNEGFMEAYKQSEVATHKEWVATMDDRTRDEHAALNGDIVPVESRFANGLQYPNEPNCRCVIAPAFEE